MPSASEFLRQSKDLGLLGPADLDLHKRHAVGFAEALARVWEAGPTLQEAATDAGPADGRRRILDLGSGGGVPGLVLAEIWPTASVGLLDASQRRCRLLERWVSEAGWNPRVSVLCGRAEDLGREASLRGTFDAVVARLFGRPAVTAECAAPFLKVGGFLVVSDPPDNGEVGPSGEDTADPVVGSTHAEDPSDPLSSGSRWPVLSLARLGLEPALVISKPFHFTVLRQIRSCPDRYPRRTGVPAKKPLF